MAEQEQLIARERAALDRRFSNLVEDEGDARVTYMALVAATSEFNSGSQTRSPLADLAFLVDLDQPAAVEQLPPGETHAQLRAVHNAWRMSYRQLIDRNPRLELTLRLQTIGRSLGTAWPFGLEARLQDWIDGDLSAPPPFDDSQGIATPAFRERLRSLRQRIGGWVYFDTTTERFVFAPEASWQAVREQVTAAGAPILAMAEQTRKQQQAQRQERERVQEIETTLRADRQLWADLLRWEREQGADAPRRPSAADMTASLSWAARPQPQRPLTADGVRSMFEDGERRFEAFEAERIAAIPPSFQPFLDRLFKPGEPPSPWAVYYLLRLMARRELGLDPPAGMRRGPPVTPA